MPPQVRDLQALIAEQTAALKPQYELLDQEMVGSQAAGEAQVAGVGAAKDREVKAIGQRAQNRGMWFSGQPVAEESDYNFSTYLPALAQLQATIASARNSLLGKKAELGKSAFDAAFQTREGDVAAKRTWDAAETDRRWQEQQAALERDFKAKESAKDRAAAAANAAREQGVSASQAFDADRKAISSELFQVTGDDGFVSPGSYAKAKNAWVGSGYDPKTFDSYFASYRNPGNKYYKLG